MVKIDVYTMMRNEIKILPYFLRHYEKFAQNIYVWDDKSTDGTREMLKSHPLVTLLPLHFEGIDDNYARCNLFPQYINLSRKVADWVMQVDVDEFVYHPQLCDQLALFRHEGAELLMPVGFLMISDHYPTTSGQIYDEIKWGLRDRLMDKPVIFDPKIEIVFGGGRHRTDILRHNAFWHLQQKPLTGITEPIDLRNDGTVQRRWNTGIKYLHFRYFGIEDFMQRIKRNCERMYLSGSEYGKMFWPYREDTKWRMPDRSKEDPRVWFAEHLHEKIQVVD